MVIGVRYPLKLVRPSGEPASREMTFLAYGPTCDGLDELPQPLVLPEDVSEGDWIEFGCMGAYSLSLRTTFNGFYPDNFAIIDAPFRDFGANTPTIAASTAE